MALMTELIKSEPSSFGEAAQHDVWQEAMVEEYDSIMKNQVWEVLPPKVYLVVFYQVSLVNRTRITCSDFREPSVLLLGSFVVLCHMFIPHGGFVINVLA